MSGERVIEAFLQRKAAADETLLSDGRSLRSEREILAWWEGTLLRVRPEPGHPSDEAVKGALIDHLLWQMHRAQVMQRLLRPERVEDLATELLYETAKVSSRAVVSGGVPDHPTRQVSHVAS